MKLLTTQGRSLLIPARRTINSHSHIRSAKRIRRFGNPPALTPVQRVLDLSGGSVLRTRRIFLISATRLLPTFFEPVCLCLASTQRSFSSLLRARTSRQQRRRSKALARVSLPALHWCRVR